MSESEPDLDPDTARVQAILNGAQRKFRDPDAELGLLLVRIGVAGPDDPAVVETLRRLASDARSG